MSDKKYGNSNFWCFIPDEYDGKEVAIWTGSEGQEEIIARAKNKYDAKTIIDALLQYKNMEDSSGLTRKEEIFLEFVVSNCVEPYATMASNAILWKDKEAYIDIKQKFPLIYE